MARSLATPLVTAALSLVVGCAPGDFDSGAASLTLSPEEGEPLQIVHASGLSLVRLTPPVDGVVELSFSYNDPLVDTTLRLDASQVEEGENVALPAVAEKLSLEVEYDGLRYQSLENSSGTVTLQVLFIDDETGAAEVSALIEATLIADGGETLGVEGFVEGSVE